MDWTFRLQPLSLASLPSTTRGLRRPGGMEQRERRARSIRDRRAIPAPRRPIRRACTSSSETAMTWAIQFRPPLRRGASKSSRKSRTTESSYPTRTEYHLSPLAPLMALTAGRESCRTIRWSTDSTGCGLCRPSRQWSRSSPLSTRSTSNPSAKALTVPSVPRDST